MTIRHNHAVLAVPSADADKVVEWLGKNELAIRITGIGERIEIYKDVGLPADVVRRFDLESMGGTHAIGHTRMATESAVTTDRRASVLDRAATSASCTTDRYPTTTRCAAMLSARRHDLRDGKRHRSRRGLSHLADARRAMNFGEALEASLDDLDGFYTFVVGTETASACCAIRSPASPP